MTQDILPPDQAIPVSGSRHSSSSSAGETTRRFRLSVGAAIGLVFSLVLVVICGAIITYVSSANRNVAGKLLIQQANANLSRYETILSGFFQEQTGLLQSIGLALSEQEPTARQATARAYSALLPVGNILSFSKETSAGREGTVEWGQFRPVVELGGTGLVAKVSLSDGQSLVAAYPLSVFTGLTDRMAEGQEIGAFLLARRDQVISFADVKANGFQPSIDQPLPGLGDFPQSPLSAIWTKAGGAHEMRAEIKGQVFPFGERMYATVYDEVKDGPAAGWIYGAIYQAHVFGSTLDQSRIIIIVAVIALAIGALLSFLLGRVIGRPLDRLADAAAHMKNLEFDKVTPLGRSRLAELDEVNSAFNSAAGALNAFSRYVPRQLVQNLVAEGMTGTRAIETRDMTIVFTDLAGFTGRAANLSAEETASFLADYFETVSRQVVAQKGTIDKFLGDGVMAFWGAPTHQPDHAAQAIASVRALAKAIEDHPDGEMRVRIGVHSGKVVVGNIGSSDRVNYTVIGDAVNVAARLQEYGKSVDPTAKTIILASADTISQLPDGEECLHIGSTELRGRQAPVDIFRVN